MSARPPEADAAEVAAADILRSPEAGGRVIRGGAVRGLGYGTGLLLGAATAVLLLRHLGVVDFGRFATVTALLGIVAGVTDAGLTAVGSREMAIRPHGDERRRLLANLVVLRIGTTVVGIAAAVAFALVAGYDRTLVYGTLIGGAGVLLINAQAMLTMPLWVELRIATLTAFDVARHALTLVGVALLVTGGASLLPFFAVQVGVGVLVLALTPPVVGRMGGLLRFVDRPTTRALLREALPLAIAFAMTVVYFRLLMILVSLLASEREVGLFGTSFRIIEVLVAAPALLLSIAVPVLSVAGQEDEARLRYGLQRMTEVSLVTAALLVVVVVILAESALVLLAGDDYRDAAPVLRIHALALVPVFLGYTWQLALISIRGQRAVAVAAGAALAVALGAGIVFIPLWGAVGGAWAAVAAEVVLAIVLLVRMRQLRPGIEPSLRFAWKVVAAAAAGAAALAIPGLSSAAAAAVAAGAFALVAFATGAVPPEVVHAFTSKLRRGEGTA